MSLPICRPTAGSMAICTSSEYSRSMAGHRGKTVGARHHGRSRQRTVFAGAGGAARRPCCLSGACCRTRASTISSRRCPTGCGSKLVGQTLLDRRYFEALRTFSAGRCVEFDQNCNDPALVEHYRRALCVVLPSVYRTIYGDETAVPELLGANSAGRDVVWAAGDMHRRGQFARGGRRRGQRFRCTAQRFAHAGRAATLVTRPS